MRLNLINLNICVQRAWWVIVIAGPFVMIFDPKVYLLCVSQILMPQKGKVEFPMSLRMGVFSKIDIRKEGKEMNGINWFPIQNAILPFGSILN